MVLPLPRQVIVFLGGVGCACAIALAMPAGTQELRRIESAAPPYFAAFDAAEADDEPMAELRTRARFALSQLQQQR
jgi:hypothetical protein